MCLGYTSLCFFSSATHIMPSCCRFMDLFGVLAEAGRLVFFPEGILGSKWLGTHSLLPYLDYSTCPLFLTSEWYRRQTWTASYAPRNTKVQHEFFRLRGACVVEQPHVVCLKTDGWVMMPFVSKLIGGTGRRDLPHYFTQKRCPENDSDHRKEGIFDFRQSMAKVCENAPGPKVVMPLRQTKKSKPGSTLR